MDAIAENPVDNTTRWRFVVAALFVIAGAAVAAVLLDSEPAAAHDPTCGLWGCQHTDHPPPPPPPPPPPCQPWPNCNQNPPPPPPPPPAQCPVGTTGTPPNCAPVEDDDLDQDDYDEDVDDRPTYSPDDTASGNCRGSDKLVDGACVPLDPVTDLQGRVQCMVLDPLDTTGLHTTTYLVDSAADCPGVLPGVDDDTEDAFWEEVWEDRCADQGLGTTWEPTTQTCGGSGLRPCFDGTTWISVDPNVVNCGASQCPVPGEPGNFIAGTNGQDCGETTPGGSGGGIDTDLCYDGIYRPSGSCPAPPPGYTPPPVTPGSTPQEPRSGNLLACRASSTVRLSWSAVTVANPQTGFDLDGWEIEWGVQGSASTTTDSLAKTARSYSRVLSTTNAWTVTLTPMLESGTAGMHSSSIDIPTGNPTSGQCPPPPPLPIPTVMACRSAVGIEVSWTLPSGTWGAGTGWVVDVNEWNGSVGAYTSYSITSSNALPWGDRAVALAVPAGQAYVITMVAYDAGPPNGWGGYSSEAQDPASDQPEAGCGRPPAPSGLPDPAPALTCDTTLFSGSFTGWADGAPADWERENEYEAQYRRSGSAGSWTSATVSLDASGDLVFSGTPDPGYEIEVQVRGRGRQRQQASGVWGAWSAWGSWGSWHTHTTSTCPVPQPSAPVGLPDPGPALACSATQFSGSFTGWADSAPTNWERNDRYEVEYLPDSIGRRNTSIVEVRDGDDAGAPARGPVVSGADPVAGSADGRVAAGPGSVLGGDRWRREDRGRGGTSGGVVPRWVPVVRSRWRGEPMFVPDGVGPVSVVWGA